MSQTLGSPSPGLQVCPFSMYLFAGSLLCWGSGESSSSQNPFLTQGQWNTKAWASEFGQQNLGKCILQCCLTPVIQEKQKYRVTKHHGDVPAIGTVFFWLRKLTSPFSSQGGQAGCLWPCPCCGYVGWLGSGWEEALLLRAFHSQLLSEENVQGFSWPKCRAVAGTVSSWPHFGAGLGFGLLSSLPYPRFLDRTGWEVLRR